MAIEFPGRIVKRGDADTALVLALQAALAEQGYGPFNTGVFDARMTAVVKQFQSQHADADGHALVVDGEIGRYTWGALFPVAPVIPSSTPSTLMLQAMGVASSQVGQMETPPGSNRGPMVDEYLRAVHIDPLTTTSDQRPWCMAFVFWAFKTAAESLQNRNPLPNTAGCMNHWARAKTIPKVVRITAAQAYADPRLIKPGLVFILDFGAGLGHTGIVERLMPGGRLMTIEGNTDPGGSRVGVGVFRLERRKLADATLKGFVDYSLA